jgi:nicotinate phosphoribosyltransferase
VAPRPAAKILESYMLNILAFSIIEANLAARISIAARGRGLVDFGLRRSQGPIAAARSAKIANFAGTSNLFASKLLDFHKFLQDTVRNREFSRQTPSQWR